MNGFARVVVLLLALGLVFGMGVHYDTQSDQQWRYVDADSVGTDYDQYVGQQVFFTGTVESVDSASNTGTIRVDYTGGSFELTVQGLDADVRPGGVVQAVGTLQPGYTLDAQTVRVVNPASSSLLFKYGVSLVGAALVTVLFLRHWRIDLRTLSFEVRSDG